MGKGLNIVRYILPRLGYLILLVLTLSVLANLYAMLIQSNVLQPEKMAKASYNTSYHVPTTEWKQSDTPNGRLLEKYDRREINTAYHNAWYFLNQALRNRSAVGLEDYFSDNLVQEIEKVISQDHEYIEDRVDLNHNMDLHLFSLDKQIIAFKDENIRIKRKIIKHKQIVFEEEIYKNFDVIMALTRGKWKVTQMKETKNSRSEPVLADSPHFVMDSIITFVGGEKAVLTSKSIVNCNAKPFTGFHKLDAGETLYKLSRKYDTSVKQLMQWNNITDLSGIKTCSHLRIAPPKKERRKIVLVTPRVERRAEGKNRIVAKGETIYDIAKEVNLQPSILQAANSLNSNPLVEGQILKMPNLLDVNKSKIKNLKGINYYPQDTPWWDFWMEYDSKIIRNDLVAIKKLGMNTIRVFVPSDGVIPGLQFSVMLDKLENLLDESEALGLDVMVTLFDFPVGFDLSYYTKSERQLEGILSRFKNHPAVLAWDLKNEPDLDFGIHSKKKVLQWLSYMIERARVYAPNHLLTIGWSNPESAVNLANELDFVSYHYYREPESLKLDMLKLKEAVNNKPLVLQEFGLPSNKKWYNPLGYSENEQFNYLTKFKKEMEENDLPYILWTLYDFSHIPTEVFGHKRWATSKQKYFGLIDHNGKKKKSYSIFAPTNK